MQFCKGCGGALNLFETNDEEVCWACVRKREKQEPPPPPQAVPADLNELAGSTFCYENDMLVLKAREGWILWSGAVTQPVTFEAIITRARHIYEVRKKRQRNTNHIAVE